MPDGSPGDLGAILAALDAGQEPAELQLLGVLRRPECPRELIDRLCGCRWVLRRRRVAGLVVRHPACKHHFAWQALPYLGWTDLHEVCRDPRTAPAIRAQAERKLQDRLASMTLGERINLARMASRGVVRAMLGDPEVHCIEALISNPHFTEDEALRLLHANHNPKCLLALLRHPNWGRRREVVRAAVRSPRLPRAAPRPCRHAPGFGARRPAVRRGRSGGPSGGAFRPAGGPSRRRRRHRRRRPLLKSLR